MLRSLVRAQVGQRYNYTMNIFKTKPSKVVWVQCYHCATSFEIAKENVRVSNYCNSCK